MCHHLCAHPSLIASEAINRHSWNLIRTAWHYHVGANTSLSARYTDSLAHNMLPTSVKRIDQCSISINPSMLTCHCCYSKWNDVAKQMKPCTCCYIYMSISSIICVHINNNPKWRKLSTSTLKCIVCKLFIQVTHSFWAAIWRLSTVPLWETRFCCLQC